MIEWAFYRVVSDLLNGYNMYPGRIDELENKKKVKVLRYGKVHCRKTYYDGVAEAISCQKRVTMSQEFNNVSQHIFFQHCWHIEISVYSFNCLLGFDGAVA